MPSHRHMFGDELSESLLSVLVDDNYDALLRQAIRYIPKRLRRLIDPEDVVHETCAYVLEEGCTWDGPKEFWRVVGRNLQRRTCDAIRRHAARRRGGGAVVLAPSQLNGSKVWVFDSLTGISNTPSREAIQKEDAVSLHEVVAMLPSETQTALWMRYWEGRPLTDVAGALGADKATARKRIIRALAILRRSMRPERARF